MTDGRFFLPAEEPFEALKMRVSLPVRLLLPLVKEAGKAPSIGSQLPGRSCTLRVLTIPADRSHLLLPPMKIWSILTGARV